MSGPQVCINLEDWKAFAAKFEASDDEDEQDLRQYAIDWIPEYEKILNVCTPSSSRDCAEQTCTDILGHCDRNEPRLKRKKRQQQPDEGRPGEHETRRWRRLRSSPQKRPLSPNVTLESLADNSRLSTRTVLPMPEDRTSLDLQLPLLVNLEKNDSRNEKRRNARGKKQRRRRCSRK